MLQALLGPAWVEVNLDNIAHNVRQIKRHIGDACKLMAVVKSDAYGHGLREVAETALDNGAGYLGVSTLSEALELRSHGVVAPILVFTPLQPEEVQLAMKAELTLTVVDLDSARRLNEAAIASGVRQRVHIKVDSGMGRYGFSVKQVLPAVDRMAEMRGLVLEGIYSHLSQSYSGAAGRGFCLAQARRFTGVLQQLCTAGHVFPLRHLVNSGGTLCWPEYHLDMVRCGNLLYGILQGQTSNPLDLREAWQFRGRVAQVRELPAGARVGYGGAVRLSRPVRTAVIPVGYADGIGLQVQPVEGSLAQSVKDTVKEAVRRLLVLMGLAHRFGNGISPVTWKGASLPLLGRISMQQVVVRLGSLPVQTGDTVGLTARRTGVNPRLPRLFLRENAPWKVRTSLGSFSCEGRYVTPLEDGAASYWMGTVVAEGGQRQVAHL